MQRLDSITGELLFGLITLVATAAPWLFGAWETWWFWPFIACIFAAGACFAVRLILSVTLGTRRLNLSTVAYGAVLAWAPLLVYALIRAIQADVRMDAERSFLLQLTPFLLAAMIATGLPAPRQRALIVIVMVNFLLLAVYGISNHYLTGNARVLWVPGFPQYQEGYHRVTGSYFCPDHFAGLMELPLALSLSLGLVRSTPALARLAALALGGISLWTMIRPPSRGGGIVACIVMIAALWLCTSSWPQQHRKYLRAAGLTGLTLAILIFALFGGHYVKRFKDYPWTALEHSDRFEMSAGALRAWQSAPWFGVGPGMHPNLWPHFQASMDANRVTGQCTTTIDTNFP